MAPLRDSDRLRNALFICCPRIRAEAVKVLGDTDDEEVVDLLLRALRDSSRGVRATAARRLRSQGAYYGCTIELLECLDDPADEVRSALVTALSEARFDEVDDRLCRLAANDPARFVRAAAVRALGGRRSETCWQTVASALWDSSWAVKTAAWETLKANSNGEAFCHLRPMLGSLEPERATALALALCHIPEPNVDAVAFAALRSPAAETRARAVAALNGRQDLAARSALVESLNKESEPSLQIAILRALRSAADESAIRLFRLLIASGQTEWAVKLEAALNLVENRRMEDWRWLLDLSFDGGTIERRLVTASFASITAVTKEQASLLRLAVAPEETFAQFCEACRWGELDFLNWYDRRLALMAPASLSEHLQCGFWAACRALDEQVADWVLARAADPWVWIDAQFGHLLEAGEWETARFVLEKLDLEGRVRIHLNDEYAFRCAWKADALNFAEFLVSLAPTHGPVIWGPWLESIAEDAVAGRMVTAIRCLHGLPGVLDFLPPELADQLAIVSQKVG